MEEKIITSKMPTTSSQLNPSTRIICRVCQKQFSQYTCPRCNARYCSLTCYKSHSFGCTESFMRENVVEELRLSQADDETKHKMLDVLKRFHSEEERESSDEEDPTLSEETVQKILSGTGICLDDLSMEERKCFHRAIASGELSKLIKPWEAWWSRLSARTISLSKGGMQLVQPLFKKEMAASAQDEMEDAEPFEIPPGPETPLPPISKLSLTEPSPLLAVHLVDIIYSYCFTLRLYNGEWQSDAIGAAMVVLSVSSVLGHASQPETVSEALCHCLEQICSPAFRHVGALQFGLALLDDVTSLLSLGGSALVCLLCDLQRLIQAAQRELKSEKTPKSRMMEVKSKLKSAERKIYFIMCWVHEQPGEAWSSLSTIVKADKGSVVDSIGNQSKLRKDDKLGGGKPMIKEIQ